VTDTLPATLLGAMLGLYHALDADHVAAVTAIVSREKSLARAARVGALWGVGHSITIFVLGGAIIAFRLVLPERLVLGLEFIVALMLIGLGFANLRGGGDAPTTDAAARSTAGKLRPLIVGTVHGLAGSAAVALMVLSTLRELVPALAYLFVFGLGTIAGMVGATILIAAPTLYAGNRFVQLRTGIRYAAGVLSIAVGLVLAKELLVAFRDAGVAP
jgi:hypothetical protein